jgi:hypothetical protein
MAYGEGDDLPGMLEVRLTDHREAIEDFEKVVIRVEGVRLHPAGLPRRKGWITFPAEVSTDLRRLTDGSSISLFRRTMEPQGFDGVDITISAIQGILETGEEKEIGDLTGPTALRFTVEAEKTVVLTLDLVVIDVRDHPGHPPYELHLREAFLGLHSKRSEGEQGGVSVRTGVPDRYRPFASIAHRRSI